MVIVTIRGVQIQFLFEPYDLQKNYMEKVLECIQNKTNAVLESPTGTGKMLSLLCSSLAWLESEKIRILEHNKKVTSNEGIECIDLCNCTSETDENADNINVKQFLQRPIVIYASRTHTQILQAMQELKRSSYNHLKAYVLGSRDQLCIDQEVLAEDKKVLRDQLCALKLKTRSCHYYNRVESKKSDPAIRETNIQDIEDMVRLGKCHKFCPYYMSKELIKFADIIFMPYNYILDPLIRVKLDLNFSNSVIILDEAHNIERVCEDSTSRQIKLSDITSAVEEITSLMEVNQPSDCFYESDMNYSPDELSNLKTLFLNLEREINNIELNRSLPEGTNFEGTFIFELLSKVGIDTNNYRKYIALLEVLIEQMADLNAKGIISKKGYNLKIFEEFLTIVFLGTSDEFKEKVKRCYRVHLAEELTEVEPRKINRWLSKRMPRHFNKVERVLSYWCFSPGFAMSTLMSQKLRSLILTSGTLAPLHPLVTELEINVDVRLENPHVIKSNQICVRVLRAGPDSECLNSNFRNRDNPKYISSLGRTILNLSRIIPNGLLIFFPSYPILRKCTQNWEQSGIWSNINAQKKVFLECKDKSSFKDAMDDYYADINDPTLKGAIFMGVCRGKISEGLDFSDINGRAVIIIGLPYPPMMEPKVILKRRYLDKRNEMDSKFLRGEDWYSLEATRAINQAIGRVIRHRNDYGAILLLDARFENYKIKSQLSMWLRNYVKIANNFGDVIKDLRIFFKNAQSILPVQSPLTILEEIPSTSKVDCSNFDANSEITDSSISLENSEELVNENEEAEVKCKREANEPPDILEKKQKKSDLISNEDLDVLKLSVKDYFVMVKSHLDNSSFIQFTNGLSCYKETEDLNELFGVLDNIFQQKNNLRYLVLGLNPYIKDRHKSAFNKYYQQLGSETNCS